MFYFFTRLFFSLLACFLLYSLVFFLYSSPRGAPETPNERFPKVLQGFGLFRVSPAGRNVFFFTRPADAPWRRRNSCFPYGLEGFGDFRCSWPPAMFFLDSIVSSLFACVFFSRLFFLYSPRLKKNIGPFRAAGILYSLATAN